MKKIKEINKIEIYRQNIFAGILVRTQSGCTFTYDQSFIDHALFKGISFKMPKTQKIFDITGDNLPAFFAGLLPEGLRLKSIITKLKTSEDDMFSLFAATGAQTIGDVHTFFDEKEKNMLEFPSLKKIDFYEYFFKILNLNSYKAGEDSIAGVQEKISASMLSIPMNIAKKNKSYILKLNSKDKTNLVDNEFYSMQLAAKCGIETARVKRIYDKNKNNALLVERFDRIWDEQQQQIEMIHQEDACQFLNFYPAQKYRISINDIADGLIAVASSDRLAILRLAELVCFSYLLCNGDLHGKNISVITNSKGFTNLTPSYDLICTLIYGDQKMALKMDGRDDNLKRKYIHNFCSRFEVPTKSIETMLNNLIKKFSANYRILKKIPMPGKKWILLEKTIQKRILDLRET